jgi:diguanylate cyclase (GGDEF)-like protein/PAS domain S-box-containing protein
LIFVRYRRLLAIVCIFIAVSLAAYALLKRKAGPPAPIRVGVDQSPPFYSINADGSVRGLAVDVLNEAARRRNIRLIWTPLHDTPIDDALSRRIVQLWPLVGPTPERKNHFFLSKPWLESDYILVSLGEHPIFTPAEAAGQVVAHARLRSTTAIAQHYLSKSRLLVKPFRADALQSLCNGEAVATLVETRVLDAILLARPAGCETADFHIATIQGATSPLSIAAVPEISAAAAALRDEITTLTKNGFLSARLDQWSPFSAEGTRSVWAGEEAEQRSRVYRFCLMLIVILATILGWVAYRARSLKQAAERAESGRLDAQRRFTAFMDHSPAVAFMKDAAGRLLYANRAWSEVFGRTPDECYGKNDFELWPGETANQLRANDEALLTGDKPRQLIESMHAPGTRRRDFLVVKFPFANARGERFVGGTAIDITEREAALRELAASEARYRELFERNPLPAWVYDRATLEFLAVNDAAVERYGWTRETFLSGMKLTQVIASAEPWAIVPEPVLIDEAHANGGAWRHQTKDGLVLSVHVTGYELDYERRRARLMIVRDVTEQERMLEQLRVGEERWQLALRGAGDALWDWDLVSGRVFRSPRWHAMLGYEEAGAGDGHEDFLRLLHPDDVKSTEAAVNAHLRRETDVFAAEYRLRHNDGSWRWIMDRGQAVWNERGPVRLAGSQTDITDRKTAEALLAAQARTDALTGLANRWEFDRLFVEQFETARTNGEPLSVCICDLDRFKEVNDSYGHAAGDRVLSTFGAILRKNLRTSDLLARVGGDEFILAMPGTTAHQACDLVENIRRQLRAEVFVAFDTSFHVTSSFGVAQLRAQHHHADGLIAEADRFLYEAKGGGRNNTQAAA